MPAEAEAVESALRRVREAEADFVHLQFTDILGTVKGVTIPASRLEAAIANGVWFDGSSVEGWARVAESDLYLRPDPGSLTLFPWETPPAARFMCDLTLPDGEPFAGDPRQALRRVLAEAAEMGFAFRTSAELEFFLLLDKHAAPLALATDGLEPSDADSYYSLPTERTMRVCQLVARSMEACGFAISATHHEVAPGQHEIDLDEHDALRAADAIATLNLALRACGRREQLLATFMPKPVAGLSGSGLHFQQVLLDARTGANVFYEPGATYGLSHAGRCFVAGQLAHARGLCALMAPLVNSYKRLTGGGEAPASIDWARINRGALVRVPEAGPDGSQIVVELRSPDPSCNPYLALAGALKAGLEGIQAGLELPDPMEERPGGDSPDIAEPDPLPSTLGEAIEELEWDPVARAALGQAIYERYLAAKEQEWLQYRNHISLWELETYLQQA
jgi:glutamine synthetase